MNTLILLGILSIGPMSGYDLKKFTEGTTDNFWHENYAQIYPMLKQLTHEGLTGCHAEKQEGRPERYVYALTDAGWQALREWLAEPVERQVERNELLLKLFFGSEIPVSVSIEHIQKFRQLQSDLLRKYEAIEASIRSEHRQNPKLPYWLITSSYGRHIAQALIAWSDETIAILRPLNNTIEEQLVENEKRS
jgi:PadR family transcriptional regulator AphA